MAHTGVVDVTNQVVAYQRRRLGTGEVLAEFPLDLPARQLRTRSVWLTFDERAVERAEVDEVELPGALHAAEHAAIGILPLLATCDRWDLGGLSTALHPDTGTPTVFVYDGHPGGAGFSQRGSDVRSSVIPPPPRRAPPHAPWPTPRRSCSRRSARSSPGSRRTGAARAPRGSPASEDPPRPAARRRP